MHIAIIALGSQGDVQPYVALGKGLQDRGHRIRLVTHGNFSQLVEPRGLEFWPVSGNVQALAETPEMRALLEKGNFIAITRHTAKAAALAAVSWAKQGLEAVGGVDLLLVGVGGLFVGLGLAEKLRIPLIQAFVFPFTPTRAFPGPLFPQSLGRLSGGFNLLSHRLVRQAIWQGIRAGDNAMRKQVLGLPNAPFLGPYASPILRRYPTLYGFSPSVIPRPADWKNSEVAGYWFLDSAPDWTPPQDLLEFLNAGAPPVYIGFGSMGSRDPEATADLVLRALRATGQRAVLQSGWSGMKGENLPDSVFLTGSVPHSWLFGRVAAVVHHGGAGTAAAGLRAGVPSVVIPFFADQPFWGQTVARLGAGTTPIPRKELTAEKLTEAIRIAVSDPEMRQRAGELGAKIRAEDGIGKVAAAIAGAFGRVAKA